jgi:hypothetical protein
MSEVVGQTGRLWFIWFPIQICAVVRPNGQTSLLKSMPPAPRGPDSIAQGIALGNRSIYYVHKAQRAVTLANTRTVAARWAFGGF